jgi:hypothetical protein
MRASFLQVLPVIEIAKRFAAAAIPGVVIWFAYHYVEITDFPRLLAACAGYTVLYALVCAVARIVTVADVKSLVGRSGV